MDNNNQFLAATVILPAANAIESASFYKEKLGFSIEVLWHEPPHAVVVRGNAVIELGEGRPQQAGSGVCYLHVSDADAVFREFRAAGVEFVDGLADRDYGLRDFRVHDNDGNLLIIGSTLPNRDELVRLSGVA